jgi:hypothetical protein
MSGSVGGRAEMPPPSDLTSLPVPSPIDQHESRSACSGVMTHAHDGTDVQVVRIGRRDVPMCAPCRGAAARLGMLERRAS